MSRARRMALWATAAFMLWNLFGSVAPQVAARWTLTWLIVWGVLYVIFLISHVNLLWGGEGRRQRAP